MLKNIKNWLVEHHKKIRLILIIYFCILTWLLLRAPKGNKEFLKFIPLYNDKLIHMLTFLGLSLLAKIAYPKKNQCLIIVLGTLYGIIIEFFQEYMKLGRTFEYSDMIADCLGCIIGAFIAKKIF